MLSKAKHGFTAAALAFGVLGAMPPQAEAASTGWIGGRMDTGLYLGGNIGQSKFRHACDGVPVSCDEKDLGWRAFAGYQFHRNFAVEGGYFHLGEASLSATGISAEAKAMGWELVGVALVPVWQQLSLFAKAGFARSRLSVTGVAGPFTAAAKDRSSDFTFGFGAQYDFTSNIGARVEWQRYDSVGGDNTGKVHLDLFSAGLLYRF